MRSAVWCFVALLSLPLFAQQKPAPSTVKPSALELTAEDYQDLIVKTADAVYLPRSSVIKGMQAPQSTPVCVVTLDAEKQKLAAQSAADHRKAWASARVPKALEASHADILSWIGVAESQYKTAPACMYGGPCHSWCFLGRSEVTTPFARMAPPPLQAWT